MSLGQSNFNIETIKPENVETEKEILWKKYLASVDRIIDGLGYPVDEKIKETVVAFLVNNLKTTASCEGHVAELDEDGHGLPYPWVDVNVPYPEGWKENNSLRVEMMNENLDLQQRLTSLFEEFYQDRETDSGTRLAMQKMGRYGAVRVQSMGADVTRLLNSEKQKPRLELYQQEMKDFTEFLKNKFFSEK